ncbi:hypothetical protein DRY71_26560 [Salmonella enterica subsp. enterica serovar Newport]|uniref:Uncharacterized protein n=1 Tax=Salmonella newport TaxID=108619 RepID=A0A5U9KYM7_SALNE|nr:hypothetical protein [Salmonella enterica subsp. enterica serovar Newport]EJH8881627.1 hypothetical protein [Salmonella enterica]
MDSLFNYLLNYMNNILSNSVLLSIIAILISYTFIKYKSGSSFSIAYKFLIIFLGNTKNKDDLINEIVDIEKFNFQFNTRAISIKQKESFELWIRKYELDFRLISKLKRNFNIDYLKIKKIKIYKPILLFISLLVIFILLFEAIIIASKDAGLVSINKSEWFWLSEKEATEYNFLYINKKDWVITPESCKKTDRIMTSLSKEAINNICLFFNSPKSKSYIENLIKEQRISFIILSIILLLGIYYLYNILKSLSAAYESRIMVYNKIKKYRYRHRNKTL